MKRILALVSFSLLACGSTKLTPVGARQEPRGPRCDFDLFTAQPTGQYVEIGTIDVNPGLYGHKVHTDLAKFKLEIQPQVCELGGDAAFGLANGHGMWIKATVLKRVQTSAASPATPTSAPPAASGCSFDTQCKGDRVCEDGRCVDP